MKAPLLISGAFAALALVACGGEPANTAVADEAANTEVETTNVVLTLEAAADGEWRNEDNKARNQYRNPAETLAFFGLEPDHVVVEITPGGGWYTEVIAPYIAAGGGTYYAAGFDTTGNERRAAGLERFKERFGDTEIFGEIQHSVVGAGNGGLAPAGTADMVLSFRNVHNWMGNGSDVEMMKAAYEALKPGGILGVVEHRLPSTAEQDPNGGTGYVHEDYMKQIAAAGGLVYVDSSEVNANPNDTADHPFGVWTLPPVRFSGNDNNPAPEGFDRAAYDAIGESDRFTMKFMKPLETSDATEAVTEGLKEVSSELAEEAGIGQGS